MTKPYVDRLPSSQRRTFLKWLALAAAAPALSPSFRAEIQEAALGRAHAQLPPDGTFLVEICMRDQLDFGHVMVPPGLARHTALKRGEHGRQCALFFRQDELIEAAPDVFLTPQSEVLRPYVGDIAMMELCELTDGPVHGHEAANPVRSPGRTRTEGNGRIAMWEGEPGGESSEGAFYSSTPTPLALHNWWQRQHDATIHNAVVIKGTERAHAMYHFGAGLPGSEPDRFQTVDALMREFPATAVDRNVLPDPGEAELVRRFLGRVDPRLLQSRGYSASAVSAHDAQLDDVQRLLHLGAPRVVDLRLTEEDVAFWSAGVPARYGRTRIDVWEQAAYALKLIEGGLVRSVALEVDIGDVHGERTEAQMRDQTLTTVLPLVRLIERFQAAGIWDRTLIAISSTDGGRAPAAGSSGDEGKNGFILAGGRIRGGYYGDVRVAGADGDGHRYSYHMPDGASGAAIAEGTLVNDRRMTGAPVWRTIARALDVPDDAVMRFPDVASARACQWMLK
ncbi:DUF1501 domain-containing protein [Sandaracinus amylolyticus]|uniref:DUF1501 domain-containing protein n=1 Tax=Sandaracinus amylolyticus TaxID=927083 RepID=UPI001F2BFDC0|nr:DUF1501 domain-containing protein [Sandaracinus amylolyticus]UJR86148.1 Hypothetical protein I5071_82300 [Sandaracinus amylolyticus]